MIIAVVTIQQKLLRQLRLLLSERKPFVGCVSGFLPPGKQSGKLVILLFTLLCQYNSAPVVFRLHTFFDGPSSNKGKVKVFVHKNLRFFRGTVLLNKCKKNFEQGLSGMFPVLTAGISLN